MLRSDKSERIVWDATTHPNPPTLVKHATLQLRKKKIHGANGVVVDDHASGFHGRLADVLLCIGQAAQDWRDDLGQVRVEVAQKVLKQSHSIGTIVPLILRLWRCNDHHLMVFRDQQRYRKDHVLTQTLQEVFRLNRRGNG